MATYDILATINLLYPYRKKLTFKNSNLHSVLYQFTGNILLNIYVIATILGGQN